MIDLVMASVGFGRSSENMDVMMGGRFCFITLCITIREGLLRGFTLKITGVIVRNRTTQLLYIGVRKTPLGYGSENAWLRK